MTTNPITGGKKAARASVALPYWVREFALIRNAVLTTLACAVVCLSGIAFSEWEQQAAERQTGQVQRLRDTAYSRYAHVDNEKRDIRAFQPRYIELRQRGLVGAENRLEWVDAIRQTQEQRHLLPLSYEIEPQQAVKLESALDLGDYTLQGSRMRLHMELLHEMDLFNFFDDLRLRSFFALQDCSIKRLATASGGATGASGPTLGADCTLNWITLAPQPEAGAADHAKAKP